MGSVNFQAQDKPAHNFECESKNQSSAVIKYKENRKVKAYQVLENGRSLRKYVPRLDDVENSSLFKRRSRDLDIANNEPDHSFSALKKVSFGNESISTSPGTSELRIPNTFYSDEIFKEARQPQSRKAKSNITYRVSLSKSRSTMTQLW